MNRRRFLLSYLANSFSWELYSKVYFYNELVPTTINGKNVLNKAKIFKVSGNGVIENQLAHEFSSTYYDRGNGATLSFLSDNTIGVLATQSYSYCCLKNIDNLFVKDHYVLITLLAKGTTNSYANVVQLYDGENWHTISGNELTANAFKRFSLLVKLRTTLTAISHFRFCQDGRTSGWDTIYAKDLMIKDITHEFGTGNEPTSLTDNRIQNILNRGYIPFNLGKYKESDIGVVSSEPYNLFDEEMSISGNSLISDNFTPIRYGGNYTVESTVSGRLDIYDENKNYLDYYSIPAGSRSFTNLQAHFVKFMVNTTTYNKTLCFHITGTRTGYAEHKTFTPITFKAQLGGAINSHNTMEITNSAYVFTRNVWKYNLGDYYWTRQYAYGRYEFYTTKLRGVAKNSTTNVICSNYTTGSRTDLADKQMAFESDGTFIARDDTYTTDSDFRTAVTGTYIYFELATPQVITIPKKHLGIKRIRDLSWGYTTANGHSVFYTTGVRNGNNYSVYCSLYLYDAGTIANNQIRNDTYFGSNYLYITDDRYTSTTDFLNECGDYLIFYETESEVADIENVIDIESGGTITTDSEVLANIELSVKCK